jgi:hypothetical protein
MKKKLSKKAGEKIVAALVGVIEEGFKIIYDSSKKKSKKKKKR